MLLTFKTSSVNKLQYTESRYVFQRKHTGSKTEGSVIIGYNRL